MGDKSPQERRKHPRRKGFWRALAFLPGRSPLNCVVRDISEGGALLQFSEYPSFPAKFKLFIEAFDCDYVCEVRHSGSYGVGVYFWEKNPRQRDSLLAPFGKRPAPPQSA